MTSIAAVECQRLGQNDGIVALVGERIYRQALPQDSEISCIVVHVKESPDETQDGPGLVLVDLELHCYGQAADAEDIAAAVESCLDVTQITYENVTLYPCHERTRWDLPYGEVTRLFGIGIKAQ